jgi:hypothetical protein
MGGQVAADLPAADEHAVVVVEVRQEERIGKDWRSIPKLPQF